MNMEEGSKSNKYDNYSIVDGSLNKKENIDYITIERNKQTNCSRCNKTVNRSDIYCNNCGELIQNVKSKREKFINEEDENNKFRNVLSNFDFVNSLKASTLSIAILLLLSIIIKIFIIGGSNQISQLINPIHIMLFSNLGSVDIFMSLFMNSAQSSVNFGFLILLILPIISFILPYRLFIKKVNTSFITHVKNSLGVAIIYAIMLAVFAKISQVEVNLSSGFNQFGYGIYFGFSTISILLKGFIIGFSSILLMGLKKDYEKENNIISIIKIAIKSIAIGYVLILLILGILYFANINYIYDFGLSTYGDSGYLGVILSQLAVYLWAFANLIPINLGDGTLSILSLFNSKGSLDLILILGAIIALSSLILIIAGCKLERKFKSNNIKPVILFSGCYALFMGIIGLLSTVYIGDNAASILNSLNAMQVGFNFIIGMIASYIYSFIMTFIGYKLNIFN